MVPGEPGQINFILQMSSCVELLSHLFEICNIFQYLDSKCNMTSFLIWCAFLPVLILISAENKCEQCNGSIIVWKTNIFWYYNVEASVQSPLQWMAMLSLLHARVAQITQSQWATSAWEAIRRFCLLCVSLPAATPIYCFGHHRNLFPTL